MAIIDRPVGSYRGLEENSRLNLLDGHESGIGLATSIWISLWHLRYSRWQRRFDLEIPIRMFASTSVIGTSVSPNIAKREGWSTKPSALEQRLKDASNAAARGAVRPMLRPWLCLCLGGRRLLKRLVGARE